MADTSDCKTRGMQQQPATPIHNPKVSKISVEERLIKALPGIRLVSSWCLWTLLQGVCEVPCRLARGLGR
ncbi:Hypothetical predicted protein [Pelobates cultripes]|uniref:Uncharacterized protein n=1 Tax=Pelobates cultripes TaxID=61616 RepID=A0AAD1RN10_PELCU|nr:Hypothetical predicted protein [Pelobates cultripes]